MSQPSIGQLMLDPLWPEATDVGNWLPGELETVINLPAEEAQRTGFTVQNLQDMPATALKDVPFPDNGNHLDLGNLARLPQELIDAIIHEMDLRSHEMFARTCHYARWLLMNDRLYRALLHWIPNIRDLLCHTGLYYWISIRNFHNELFQPTCRACPRAGDCLFLATGERICHVCMVSHSGYWYLNLSDAQKAFFLTIEDLKRVPAIRFISQRYVPGQWPQLAPSTVSYLFPVKCLLQASIRKFGSQANLVMMGQVGYQMQGPAISVARQNEENIFHTLRQSRLQPVSYYPAAMQVSPPFGKYLGAALTWLPHVTKEGYEIKRYFCKGCSHFFRSPVELDNAALRYMGIDPSLSDSSKKVWLTELRCNTRSWEEMLEHIPKCAGCAMLMMRYYRTPLQRALDEEFGPNH